MTGSASNNQDKRILQRWGIVTVLVIFLGLAGAYSLINPLQEATDELRHYRFVRILGTEGRLPVQGQEPCRAQGHHPPLFYALAALPTAWIETDSDICATPVENPFWAYRYWEVGRDNKAQYLHGQDESFPWYGDALAAHIARGVNILLGALVVFLTWATGKIIWPRKDFLAIGAAALVAFNPMFLYLSAAINNDIIAALAGAAITYACIRLLINPRGLNWRWGAVLGLLFGAALMSKFNLAATILLIEAAITWIAWKKRQWREWITANVALFSVTLLVSGWWFIRNQMLYGEPTGFRQVTKLWGVRDPLDSLGLALSEVPYAFTTLWGRFGFGQIPLPTIIYNLLLALTLLGLIGAVLGFIGRSKDRERWSLAFLFANVILFTLVLFNYMLVSPAGPNGRFFFPAISSFALLILYGLGHLIYTIGFWIVNRRGIAFQEEGVMNNATKYSGLVVSLGMFSLALVALFAYLGPAYARPRSFSADDDLPNPVIINFDQLVSLVGYKVTTSEDGISQTLLPGEPLDIELYWQVNNRPPGNYLLFVHLLDQYGSIVAQRDTHPGLGNFPSSQWRSGDRFVEEIRLYTPETAYTPSKVRLSVGLYDPGAYRLAVTDINGLYLGDAFELTSLNLKPKDGEYPNPQDQNFNNEIKLIGYEYDRQVINENQDLEVTLYWQSLDNIETDYIVQVDLLSGDGQIVSSTNSRPKNGDSPTNTWKKGDLIEDIHILTIEPGTPAGSYLVDISLIDAETNRAQNIVADDGHWIDNNLILAPIRIDQ
ncbi:MAG: hypothetical protein BMS9Abin02_0634 [Anaerolineae bacterium]|nr:MAG: hypothetical protein BMS9Abin02_0634 [Anaerolineae bacterium]